MDGQGKVRITLEFTENVHFQDFEADNIDDAVAKYREWIKEDKSSVIDGVMFAEDMTVKIDPID